MKTSITTRTILLLAIAFSTARTAVAKDTAYNPLALKPGRAPPPLDLTVVDQARSREIPIRVYLPAARGPAPVVLFSHGLGGSRKGSTYLGEHWSARGYLCVFLQHPGSDISVWEGKSPADRLSAARKAASVENFLLRAKDVPMTLDQLDKWNAEPGHKLAGRLDMQHVGMSGHSFGAITTEAVSGQVMPGRLLSCTDSRIRAAVIFSPSTLPVGAAKQTGWQSVLRWLVTLLRCKADHGRRPYFLILL